MGIIRAPPIALEIARVQARRGSQSLLAMLHSDHDAFWNARGKNYPLSASLIFYLLDSRDRQEVLGKYLGTLAASGDGTLPASACTGLPGLPRSRIPDRQPWRMGGLASLVH